MSDMFDELAFQDWYRKMRAGSSDDQAAIRKKWAEDSQIRRDMNKIKDQQAKENEYIGNTTVWKYPRSKLKQGGE